MIETQSQTPIKESDEEMSIKKDEVFQESLKKCLEPIMEMEAELSYVDLVGEFDYEMNEDDVDNFLKIVDKYFRLPHCPKHTTLTDFYQKSVSKEAIDITDYRIELYENSMYALKHMLPTLIDKMPLQLDDKLILSKLLDVVSSHKKLDWYFAEAIATDYEVENILDKTDNTAESLKNVHEELGLGTLPELITFPSVSRIFTSEIVDKYDDIDELKEEVKDKLLTNILASESQDDRDMSKSIMKSKSFSNLNDDDKQYILEQFANIDIDVEYEKWKDRIQVVIDTSNLDLVKDFIKNRKWHYQYYYNLE